LYSPIEEEDLARISRHPGHPGRPDGHREEEAAAQKAQEQCSRVVAGLTLLQLLSQLEDKSRKLPIGANQVLHIRNIY